MAEYAVSVAMDVFRFSYFDFDLPRFADDAFACGFMVQGDEADCDGGDGKESHERRDCDDHVGFAHTHVITSAGLSPSCDGRGSEYLKMMLFVNVSR